MAAAQVTFHSIGPLIAGIILVVSGIVGIIIQKKKSK